MAKSGKILLVIIAIVIVGGGSFLTFSSGLKSDLSVGLSPDQHSYQGADVRRYTDAPLGAEVKVYLPIPPREAVSIVYDYDEYANWVVPAPKDVSIDNSKTADGQFGAGSLVTNPSIGTDQIMYLDEDVSMIARPQWGQEDFKGHHGAIIVMPHKKGSLMHMRRYFETTSFKGGMMSKIMPFMMKASAQNLVKKYGGEVY